MKGITKYLLVLVIFASACSGTQIIGSNVPTQPVVQATETVKPTVTQTPVPTKTPTIVPTATFTSTPTEVLTVWDCETTIDDFIIFIATNIFLSDGYKVDPDNKIIPAVDKDTYNVDDKHKIKDILCGNPAYGSQEFLCEWADTNFYRGNLRNIDRSSRSALEVWDWFTTFLSGTSKTMYCPQFDSSLVEFDLERWIANGGTP